MLMSIKICLPVALALLLASTAPAQIRISEVAPTNTGIIADEDGDNSDWLELFNSGGSTVNLAGYSLGDASQSGQWILPGLDLPAGQRLLVFCSGKNRGGNPVAPPPDHWETAVYEDNSWRYTIGQTPADWASAAFDDSSWPLAPGGFGYGDGDDATLVPAGVISMFIRCTFQAPDTSQLTRAVLHVDYDDAFAAYLNGVEIARSSNLPEGASWNTPASADHEAVMYTGGPPESFLLNKDLLINTLQPGINVLSVEIHNVDPASSDLSGRVWLSFGIAAGQTFFGPVPDWFDNGNPGGGYLHTSFKLAFGERLELYAPQGNIVDSVTLGALEPGHSLMRVNDAGAWCIAAEPTPNAENTATCLDGYAEAPSFSLNAGFYAIGQNITLNPGGAGTVRYTTDGSFPDASSPVFPPVLNIGQTSLLRARRFANGQHPSRVTTATYFINEPTTLSVVSIALDPDDFQAVYTDYYEKGRVNVEFFDHNQQRQLDRETAGYVVGNWSVVFPQKSMQFDCDEEWGSLGEFEYPLFVPGKPIQRLHSFRIRNEDDDATGARMRDRIVNELARPTHAGQAAYRNVVAFINGEYWGLYSARERLDNYFIRDNYGADPDSVNMVKTHWGQGDYTAEYGTLDDFFDLSDFIADNDMSDPVNFEAVNQRLDLENFTDYFAIEIYVASTDWLQDYFNNVRLFRTPEQRWQFLLWDVSYSSGAGSACVECDVLGSTLANPFGSRYGVMFNRLLGNQAYKQFFINRFADLMNYYWLPEQAHSLIDQNAAEMAPEIDRHHQRWSTGDLGYWGQQVDYLKSFYAERAVFQRQHLRNHFNLGQEVDITLQVNPPGAGHIKISTIIPQELPWTGIYFQGNPVTLTAIPAPGYVFSGWSANPFISNLSAQSFSADLSGNTVFNANFNGEAAPNTLMISEINYHSDPTTDAGDWIELHNDGGTPLDISDYRIGDEEWYHLFTLPTGTVLPPNGRLVLYESQGRFETQHPDVTQKAGPLGFSLDNKGDVVRVMDAFGTTVENAVFDNKKPWPCTPAGLGRSLERQEGAVDPNQPDSWFDGCMGGSPVVPYEPCDDDLVVSEINYNSPAGFDAGDWIEVYNRSMQNLDLSGWRIRDEENDHAFTIPAGTVLPPGGRYVFVQNEAIFQSVFPLVANAGGPLGFGLNGSGDHIRLYDTDGRLQFSLCYDDTAPWPVEADGQGYTLELADYSANPNDADNWFAGCYGGSPGQAYDPDCAGVGVDAPLPGFSSRVFPNPAGSRLQVETVGADGTVTMTFYNALGIAIAVHRATEQLVDIDTSNWQPGLYLLIIETSGGFTQHFLSIVK